MKKFLYGDGGEKSFEGIREQRFVSGIEDNRP